MRRCLCSCNDSGMDSTTHSGSEAMTSPQVPSKIEQWAMAIGVALAGRTGEDRNERLERYVAEALQSAYARGRAEGMEEAAKIADGTNILTTSLCHGAIEAMREEIADRIRAAARPASEKET